MPANNLEERQNIVLRLLQERKEDGMRQLFEHYGGALMAIIQPIVEREEVAEEVFHDVLLKIWYNIGQYEDSKSRLFTWMARIARNAAIDKVRSKSYRKTGKTDVIDDSVGRRKELSQTPSTDQIGIARLLTHLDDNHRAIIDLLYFKDFTQSETAKELDLPLGTVKTRARRAIRQLRELLRNEMI
ncbi:MAG: sigma-70 family RNA polymerase sigma factor [Bacteroidota bacterium]